MPRRTQRGKRRGRPTRLTPEVAERVVTAVERGNHIITACALSGVPRTTLYRWLDRANTAEEAAEQSGAPVDPDEWPYVEFRDRLAEARARAEADAVRVVEKAMRGGFVTSEEPVVDDRGNPVRGEDGEVLWKRTYTAPDGRLALAYLGRSRPDVWGQSPTQHIEVTAVGDGSAAAGVAGDGDRITVMAKRLAAVTAQRRDEDEAGVVEGEIVEEE